MREKIVVVPYIRGRCSCDPSVKKYGVEARRRRKPWPFKCFDCFMNLMDPPSQTIGLAPEPLVMAAPAPEPTPADAREATPEPAGAQPAPEAVAAEPKPNTGTKRKRRQ